VPLDELEEGRVARLSRPADPASDPTPSPGPGENSRVIAVEYAMLPQFAGNSYGVPSRYALDLIGGPKR